MPDTPIRIGGQSLRDGRGVYHWKREAFTSVTTILGAAIPKPALPRWAAKCVAEHVCLIARELEKRDRNDLYVGDLIEQLQDVDALKQAPWTQSEKKRDLGTRVHDLCECVALGDTLAVDAFGEELRPYVQSFLAWIVAAKPVYELVEAPVFNRTHGYAGTLDSMCTVAGKRYVLDYKCSKDTYPEHALQLAAYRHAEFVGLPDKATEVPMPPTDAGAILLIGEDGCRMVEWPCGDEVFAVFHGLIPTHEYLRVKREPRTIMETAAPADVQQPALEVA